VNIDQMRTRLATIETDLIRLGELDEPTDEQVTEFETLTTEETELRASLQAAEQRAARAAELRARVDNGTAEPVPVADAARTAPAQHTTRDPIDVLMDRGANPGQVRDAALHTLERLAGSSDGQRRPEWDRVERAVRADQRMARHVTAFGSEEYEDAFYSLLRAGEAQWAGLTPEQRQVAERAAVVVGTTTQGGFLLPTHLDPTVMLTNDGTINPFRRISRVVSLTEGETWYGVTSAGITASWDAELAEVSDDSPTFAQPSVPVYKGQAFALASDEAVESIMGLPSELLRLFSDARDRLEAAAFATGTGSAQPTGIFTALDANTNVEIEVGTAQALNPSDIYGAHAAVPARFRGSSTWLMSRSLIDEIRQLGTANNYHAFTVDLAADGIERLLGKQIAESEDAPAYTDIQTTTVDNLLVVGDFSNFVIVDKVGARVRYSPEMYGTTNARPIGAQGWRMYWRVGSDSVLDTAFRLLQDGTSA
jgi:HK97 family phage major capsid protein